ncbi:hypothetical protein [Roseomonas genomospecies 6]|uniref:Uncharacterized protein n=1 Tax=Roseomonas genomospecies 6 TaxID=214106 RepID=A0A9W7KQF6_9PROT|nr:hypothetical protein [Roseomonas genomospecies 6]KAA0677627.1 hypothetical protein DS843_22570 [Roseomonas genomospecies 6]
MNALIIIAILTASVVIEKQDAIATMLDDPGPASAQEELFDRAGARIDVNLSALQSAPNGTINP